MGKSQSYKIDQDTGFLVMPVSIRNKHGVNFDIKAKLDTGKVKGEINYKIYSALGLETLQPISGNTKKSALNVLSHAWVTFKFDSGDFEKEGDFVISDLENDIDLIIGMDWILKYFVISIDPIKGIFEIKLP